MNHHDHVRLIEPGIGRNSGGVWAEFGAGTGAFSLALRHLAGPDVEITAVDDDAGSLHALRSAMERHFPDTRLHLQIADFSLPLPRPLPPLDGILAANSMHYVAEQAALLERWRGYLKPGGRLIVVEYDTDRGNRWVPYPLSFAAFSRMALAAGFTAPEKIGTYPSRFLGGFYSALASPA